MASKERTVTGYYSDDTLDKQFRQRDPEFFTRKDQRPGGLGGDAAADKDWAEYYGKQVRKGQ
jgi:hypothetical protein